MIINLTYPPQRLWHAFPALSPARGLPKRISLGRSPSLHPLRRRLLGVVRGLRGYYGIVRLPMFVHHRRVSLDFPMRPAGPSPQVNMGPPGSRARCFRTCTGSRTARGSAASCVSDATDVAFRFSLQRRHPGEEFSRLNTRPARTPVNASATPSRAPPHDSGPLWPAKPSTYDSCIHNTLPV